MYDPYYPASENSPYLENEESKQNLYFENHYEEDESIESTMYYQQNYTLVDTTKTSFDSTKVDIILESIKSLLNPENGNGVTIQEMSMTAVSGLSVPNYLKFFVSKVKTSDTAYQFRYHILFYAKGSSDIKIASSHSDSTATHIKTSDVSFPSGEITAINIKITKREGNSSITFTSKFEDESKSISISFPTCFENSAGYDRDYDVIDIARNKDSFASYKTKMLSYIQSISFNVTPTISNSTVEILSEDDEESNLKNHNLPFIYAYVSRYKVISGSNTYYRNYHYYYFYFSSYDGNLKIIYNKAEAGFLTSNLTSSQYPIVEICSNNAQTHTFGTANIAKRSRIIPYSFNNYNNSIIVTIINYLNNSNVKTNVDFTYYVNTSPYLNLIDKTKTEKDFNYNDCVNYLKENVNHYTSLGSDETLEFKKFTDSKFPYLYFVLSRRKTSSTKYYYFVINTFFYSTGDNNNNVSYFRRAEKYYRNVLSQATNQSDWFNISIHAENASLYPSYIGNKHNETSSTYIFIDFSFYNEKDVLTTSPNQQINIFTNAFSTNCGDTSFIDESNGSRILHNDVRNQLNSYNIMNKLDESKPIRANVYLKDGVYYFSGYFYKENNNNKVTFNNKFAFIASNYGYSYFSPNSTSESGYRKYIYESDLSGYKFKNVSYKSFSQKENPVFIFTFENNHGSIKEYALRMDGIGARAKYYSRSFFEKHKSDKINFTYNINLKPKNNDVKDNYKEILRCFNFNLDLKMVQKEIAI